MLIGVALLGLPAGRAQQQQAAMASCSFLWRRQPQRRGMVSIHGRVTVSSSAFRADTVGAPPPPDPQSLLTRSQLDEKIGMLLDWWETKDRVLCITGAGISTESGIPDYRGSNGSYHRGHKPMVHDQFVSSSAMRKRYWGRSMVGWREFDSKRPSAGHYALAELERLGRLGVEFEDFFPQQQKLSIITQNVDSLHQRAGSIHVTDLHGRGNVLKCMKCGNRKDRNEFHREMIVLNKDWLNGIIHQRDDIRPDGDANIENNVNYDDIVVPPCRRCGEGFFKPDVVFFGDNVPRSRVAKCAAAVRETDGLLVVGSSLAVHSAFRHVRAAASANTPIAILNVGETRAEAEGLPGILKIEAPAGATLAGCVDHFSGLLQEQQSVSSGPFH